MKNIFYCALVILFTACNISPKSDSEGENSNESIKIVDRDFSITPSNAYNNFFFDTAALSSYINDNDLSKYEAATIRNFYYKRNLEFAWFNPNGLTEELRNFWNMYTYSDTTKMKSNADKKLFRMLDTLLPSLESRNISNRDRLYTKAEIAITRKFLVYVKENFKKQDEKISRLLPVKKYNVYEYAEIILKEDRDTSRMTKIEKQYDALKQRLKGLMSVAKDIPGDTIPYAGKLKKGKSSPSVAAVKRRLARQGYLPASDTSSVYTGTLAEALKKYQASVGLYPDGKLHNSVIKRMNEGPRQLVAQLLVNMNRLLWLPPQLPDHYILVNIPEFMLHAYEKNRKVFDMAVVVGREGTSTMMFCGDMNNIVFSPYWNVPESIIKKEILPGMERNPDYLESHNMEITGNRGDLPVVRQLPGDDNSLGR
jgi:murein L,D-transpeptidase YcbB/YkuD